MAAAPALTVRIGHRQVDAATPALEEAIRAENDAARMAGLPDTLNPAIIDPAKARALVHGLSPASLAALNGKPLLLSPALLRIGASAPTTVASFEGAVALEGVQAEGPYARAHATVKVDCALAAKQTEAARTAFTEADHAVAGREAAHPSDHAGLVALSDERSRRFAIATVWKENAASALDCHPADATAKQDLDAASRAVAATIQAPRRGMPSK